MCLFKRKYPYCFIKLVLLEWPFWIPFSNIDREVIHPFINGPLSTSRAYPILGHIFISDE